jgi:hypothetical protein
LSVDRDELMAELSNKNIRIDALNKELEKERDNSLELVKSKQESEGSNQENEIGSLSSKIELLNTEKISCETEIESLVRFIKYRGFNILKRISKY